MDIILYATKSTKHNNSNCTQTFKKLEASELRHLDG